MQADDTIYYIRKLAQEKDAIILSHYYQSDDVQDAADFIGDSLELARKAKNTPNKVILLCGVYFMAEVAKVLNPSKTVIVPDINAGCSLSDACPVDAFRRFRAKYPDHVAVTYVNSSLAVKAESDFICTSANAVTIVNSIPKEKKIIFAPDKYLGSYVAKETGRDLLLWDGTCIVHEAFEEKEVIALQIRYPDAEIIAHPECPENILKLANFIGSTSKLLKYVSERNGSTFIVLTEHGILHSMKKISPHSIFISPENTKSGSCKHCSQCPYMRLNTIEKMISALKNLTPEIQIDQTLAEKTNILLDKMVSTVSAKS